MALALQAEQNDGDCVAEAMGNVERPAKGSYRTSTTATGTAKENTEMAKQEKEGHGGRKLHLVRAGSAGRVHGAVVRCP